MWPGIYYIAKESAPGPVAKEIQLFTVCYVPLDYGTVGLVLIVLVCFKNLKYGNEIVE